MHLLKTDFMFSVQGKLTFILFLLKILWNSLSFGKCLFTKFKNRFAPFVLKYLLNGGLNYTIFRRLFFVSCCLFYTPVSSIRAHCLLRRLLIKYLFI